jgi:cell division protein FtsZ
MPDLSEPRLDRPLAGSSRAAPGHDGRTMRGTEPGQRAPQRQHTLAPAPHEEDELEIPAFLRRNAN